MKAQNYCLHFLIHYWILSRGKIVSWNYFLFSIYVF